MSLHKKLTRSYVTLIAAVAVILLLGSFLSMCLFTLPNIRLSMQSKVSELINRIDEEYSYLERAADTAFLNLNEIEYPIISGEDGNELQRYNKINSCLYLMRSVYTDVKWAFLFDSDGQVYADNVLIERALEKEFDSGYHSALESDHGRTYAYGLRRIDALDEETPVLLVGKKIRYVYNLKDVGYLYVATDKSVLDGLYSEQRMYSGQQIYICGRDGMVLSSTDGDSIGRAFGREISTDGWFIRHNGRFWLYKCQHIDRIDADIVLMIPMGEFFRPNLMYVLVILVATAAGLFFAFRESANITRRILDPLYRLTETMNEVRSGNMDVRSTEEMQDDEIGLLASSFNHMLGRIEELIESVKKKQQEKTYIELALQQNKIQPHFLYNSLNTVSALCQMDQLEEASNVSQLIAEYYRAVLSGGRDIVTVGEELNNVELYLRIIQASRSAPLKYSVQCSERAANCLIPKLSLQPFAENSVKHGFCGTAEDELKITVTEENGYVSISVIDNGIGTEPELLRRAMNANNSEHFGIYSVCRRMQLLCGDNYCLLTDSVPGVGTVVTLRYSATALEQDGDTAAP